MLKFAAALPQPPATLGFYRDVTVLALPLRPGRNSLQLDGKNQTGAVEGARLVLTLSPGKHVGVY